MDITKWVCNMTAAPVSLLLETPSLTRRLPKTSDRGMLQRKQ